MTLQRSQHCGRRRRESSVTDGMIAKLLFGTVPASPGKHVADAFDVQSALHLPEICGPRIAPGNTLNGDANAD